MELTGNAADRWEQVSNKLNELVVNMSAKQELVKAITASLEELNTDLNDVRQTLEQLGNVAYKEVLREESNTLNDEDPVILQPEQKTESNTAEIPQTDEQVAATSNEKASEKQKKSKKASIAKDDEDDKNQDLKQATLMGV